MQHPKRAREEGNFFMKIFKEQFVSLTSDCTIGIFCSYYNSTVIKCVPSTFTYTANTQGSYFVYQEIHRTNTFFYLCLKFESLVNSLLISRVNMSQYYEYQWSDSDIWLIRLALKYIYRNSIQLICSSSQPLSISNILGFLMHKTYRNVYQEKQF